ncbi:hypothetical protein I7I51_09112 [Histoplasma capsulatum]|uniref:Uncharacterized protein n=1 Tax=Ajellomyces capsulatus TaxID=5037 RepID=A0A8A1LZS8_AJECA|nr:hypothetical protein I7I51_09112 [Histoplasma capsulatum]
MMFRRKGKEENLWILFSASRSRIKYVNDVYRVNSTELSGQSKDFLAVDLSDKTSGTSVVFLLQSLAATQERITAVAANPDGVVARQSVARRARIAAEEAAASIQEADVAVADLHAHLAQFVIRPLGLGNAENLARILELTTTTTTTTKTVPPGGEPSGFSCTPMTVTNSLGDSLELGDNCALRYFHAKTATSSEAARALRIRQGDCPPTRTTSTVYATEGAGGFMTVTATVTGSNSAPPGFSCTPMTVTNAAGDELVMDDKCATQLATAAPKGASQPGTAGRGDIFVATRYAVLGSIAALLIGLFLLIDKLLVLHQQTSACVSQPGFAMYWMLGDPIWVEIEQGGCPLVIGFREIGSIGWISGSAPH